MAALFLRGGPTGLVLPRRHWPRVLSLLRRETPGLGAVGETLRRYGMWEAAVLVETPGALSWAEAVVEARRCVTVEDPNYPRRLVAVLGGSAPPALWCSGDPARLGGRAASVVGSRKVSGRVASFAYRAGEACARQGSVLVSGGALGCDSLAETGAKRQGGECVRILAQGLGDRAGQDALTMVSVCAPDEEFSSAAAMERNALIYAMSERALVVQSRFREGGTWHGAMDAFRRRLTTLFYRQTPDLWGRAFRALGGRPVTRPEAFLLQPVEPAPEARLFDFA